MTKTDRVITAINQPLSPRLSFCPNSRVLHECSSILELNHQKEKTSLCVNLHRNNLLCSRCVHGFIELLGSVSLNERILWLS